MNALKIEKGVSMPWPTHPDGRQMTLGEMTPEQREVCLRDAGKRFEQELRANAPAIEKVLRDFEAAIAKAGAA